MTFKNTTAIIGLTSAVFIFTGCAPVVVGGGALLGSSLATEKGLSGTLADSQISRQIELALYQKDPDIHRRVSITVQNGEVMLTGALPSSEEHLEVVRIAWEPKGVKRVIDNIAESEGASVGTYTQDTWITTQLKSALLFDRDIESMNYSLKTVSGQVYVMGIAQDQAELEKVLNHARNTSGVTKVISYAHLKGSAAL